MVSFSSVALFVLACVSCPVNATRLVGRAMLDVAAPPVTYPTKGVVWKAGETQTVTWDISGLPSQISNPIGSVILGWIEGNGYNLQLDTPLAKDFPITAGKVNVVVPSQYPDRDTYIIALIGSSGNISPNFTITGGSTGGSSSSGTVGSPSSTISVPGTPPSTTLGSSSSIVYDTPSTSPSPSSSVHSSSVLSLSLSSVPSSSPSPSGGRGGSGEGASRGNSAWGNKPANKMAASLASLVALFL